MKKILCLDDSRTALFLTKKLLSDVGEVFAASTPVEAEKVLSATCIDLFLFDYTLGEINGIDFTKTVRNCPEYSKTPIMIVSGSYSEQLAYEAMKAGVNECFAKPINKDDFKTAVIKQLAAPYVVEVAPTTMSVKCFVWEKCGFFYQYSPQIEQLVRDTSSEGASKKMQELLRINLKNPSDDFEFIVEKASVYYTVNLEP